MFGTIKIAGRHFNSAALMMAGFLTGAGLFCLATTGTFPLPTLFAALLMLWASTFWGVRDAAGNHAERESAILSIMNGVYVSQYKNPPPADLLA